MEGKDGYRSSQQCTKSSDCENYLQDFNLENYKQPLKSVKVILSDTPGAGYSPFAPCYPILSSSMPCSVQMVAGSWVSLILRFPFEFDPMGSTIRN